MRAVFSSIAAWYMAHINYGTVMLLMAIESSFFPLPSEIVIPPAAWKAASGDMNIILVVLFGTIGALIGSLFNYGLGYFLGRKLIYKLAATRFAKVIMVTPTGIGKAENYFLRHGRSSTLIGRLVPGIRHLISIPAGMAKMKLRDFILYTVIGSGIWNIILAGLSYALYSQRELLDKYFNEIKYVLLAAGVIFVGYLIVRAIRKKG